VIFQEIHLSETAAIPLWIVGIIVGIIGAIVVYFTVKHEEPPKFFMVST
jgi:hypothetical protein